MRVDEREESTERMPPLKEDKAVGIEQEIVAMENETPSQDNQLKVSTMKLMLSHRVKFRKRISQNIHSIFISLQGAEHTCNEALIWLTPIFH